MHADFNILQINTPFTLAPPLAARNLYSSIPGAARLPPPYSNFYSFPCLNPPVLAFEFATWMFPVFQGGLGIPLEGGERAKMSLGKLDAGSGMCVGVIVEMPESMIGARDGPGKRRKKGTKTERVLGDDGAGNGLRDIWVLGETFWRGIGGVFDVSTAVGARLVLQHWMADLHSSGKSSWLACAYTEDDMWWTRSRKAGAQSIRR